MDGNVRVITCSWPTPLYIGQGQVIPFVVAVAQCLREATLLLSAGQGLQDEWEEIAMFVFVILHFSVADLLAKRIMLVLHHSDSLGEDSLRWFLSFGLQVSFPSLCFDRVISLFTCLLLSFHTHHFAISVPYAFFLILWGRLLSISSCPLMAALLLLPHHLISSSTC